MSALLVSLIVFLSLLGVTVIVFNSIYLLNRRNINWDYKLKSKFNYYKNNAIGSNLKSIETLVKKNKGLEPILEYLKNCHMQYTRQLEIVKVQLQKNSEELQTLRIISTWRKIKQIRDNFEALDKQQQEFKNVNINTQKYLNTCSKIATEMFEITSAIGGFQKENFFHSSHSDIKQLGIINREINDLSMLINNDINYIDANKIHRLFLSELTKIKELHSLTANLYEIDKYSLALETIVGYGNEIVNDKKLKATDKARIAQKIDILASKKLDLKDLLKQSQFKRAEELMLTTIIELENALIEVKTNQKYKEVFDLYSGDFQANVSLFYEQLSAHKIKDVYTDIANNFKNDHEVVKLIYSNIDLANSISLEIENYSKDNFNPAKPLSTAKAVQYFLSIYKAILQFQLDNQKLLSLIEDKHKNFVEVIYRLHDAKLKISDLERLMADFNVQNPTLTEKINQHKKQLEQIKASVLASFINLDQSLSNELTELDEFINNSFVIIKMDINLINIIKRLKMYAARYQQLATKEQLQALDKLYKKHQYYDLIEAYIDFIQKMKKLKRVS